MWIVTSSDLKHLRMEHFWIAALRMKGLRFQQVLTAVFRGKLAVCPSFFFYRVTLTWICFILALIVDNLF